MSCSLGRGLGVAASAKRRSDSHSVLGLPYAIAILSWLALLVSLCLFGDRRSGETLARAGGERNSQEREARQVEIGRLCPNPGSK
jgi:hypothetical protein